MALHYKLVIVCKQRTSMTGKHMSRTDKYTNTYSPCPCGNGRILEHVDSPDNAYRQSHFKYELSCSSCCRNWVLSNNWLFDKEAFDAKNNSHKELQCCGERIEILGAEAINQIIADGNFLDYKSEYTFLKEDIGLCKEGPIKYKKSRVEGKRPSSACYAVDASIHDEEIILIIQHLDNDTIKDQLNELIREYDSLEHIYEEATGRLNSRSISSLLEQ